MKQYKGDITLVKNNRGCYILDTVKGCSICRLSKPKGCYGNCYAKAIADRYKLDFGNPVYRTFHKDDGSWLFDFSDLRHKMEIIRAIQVIDMPFVRIGEMGDPSENWKHTLEICKEISLAKKPIVIITKHWFEMPIELYGEVASLNLCINTSVSALDSPVELGHRLKQYERLKKVCKSVLRVVSCKFNRNTIEGEERHAIQEMLFSMGKVIDTTFRPSANNPLVTSGVILVEKKKFLNQAMLASTYNADNYFGRCEMCPEMCGINI